MCSFQRWWQFHINWISYFFFYHLVLIKYPCVDSGETEIELVVSFKNNDGGN